MTQTNKIFQLDIFGNKELVYSQIEKTRKKKKGYSFDFFFQEWCAFLNFTSNGEMPKVARFDDETYFDIIGFHRLKSVKRRDLCPHFYLKDKMLCPLITKRNQVIKSLKKFPCVIGPDFSVKKRMAYAVKLFIIFLNKLLSAQWSKCGIRVIPNLVWVEGVPLELCFNGFPKHSVVAINSTGLGTNKWSKKVWEEGYKYIIEHLQPKLILRYGPKQPCEIEEISRYYDNDNYTLIRQSLEKPVFKHRAVNYGW